MPYTEFVFFVQKLNLAIEEENKEINKINKGKGKK